ncbi:alpha/beta fold hydrolase [Yinghuangia sp. YIM S09857]|uniref:alpha/beta fold hydrolase n=1 Tax=Yinghuangia sp. YIM S09857 TaxID=3436929 RepID=UPI003F53B068
MGEPRLRAPRSGGAAHRTRTRLPQAPRSTTAAPNAAWSRSGWRCTTRTGCRSPPCRSRCRASAATRRRSPDRSTRCGPKWVDPPLPSRTTVPTLIIHGRDDRVVSYEVSLQLLALVPDSRLVLLNRCGHWVMIEHADEFNRLMADFVRNA